MQEIIELDVYNQTQTGLLGKMDCCYGLVA